MFSSEIFSYPMWKILQSSFYVYCLIWKEITSFYDIWERTSCLFISISFESHSQLDINEMRLPFASFNDTVCEREIVNINVLVKHTRVCGWRRRKKLIVRDYACSQRMKCLCRMCQKINRLINANQKASGDGNMFTD